MGLGGELEQGRMQSWKASFPQETKQHSGSVKDTDVCVQWQGRAHSAAQAAGDQRAGWAVFAKQNPGMNETCQHSLHGYGCRLPSGPPVPQPKASASNECPSLSLLTFLIIEI